MPRYQKTPFRILLVATLSWLAPTTAVLAQDVTSTLNPAEVAEIMRLVDLQPISQGPPPALTRIVGDLGRER